MHSTRTATVTATTGAAAAPARPLRERAAPSRHRAWTLADAAGRPRTAGQDGSMVAEYGLIAVLGATIVGVAISWAQGGAIAGFLAAVLQSLRGVVAA